MRDKVRGRDALAAEIAAGQHGVISLVQMIAVGFTRSAIARRVAAGRLHRVHRAVYAVGHPGLSARGRWKAATLALGERAVLSHSSAAALWGLVDERTGPPHVTVAGAADPGRRSGIRVHRSASLVGSMTTALDGIPVTRPARTLEDLERSSSPRAVRRARRQAEYLGLSLGEARHGDRTRSDLESDFCGLIRRAGAPEPEVNVRIGPYTVDFLWRERRLVVETDGWAAHRGWQAFQDDHVRDAYLARVGLRVQRISDWQVDNEPEAVVATVLAGLRNA